MNRGLEARNWRAMESNQMESADILTAMLNGDIDAEGNVTGEDTPAAPAADSVPEQIQDAAAQPEGKVDEVAEQPAPIASKSGAYTIPYEKLTEARDKAKAFEEQVHALQQQLTELSARQSENLANAQAQSAAGNLSAKAEANLQTAQDAIDAGVNADIFGDFTDESIAKGIRTLQAQERDAMRAELLAEIQKELAPIRQEREQAAVDGHYSAIYEKHKDADEIVQSDQFQKWVQEMPAFMKAGVDDVLKNGSAQQIIEVFDSFKSASAPVQKPPEPQNKAVLEVQRRVPASLSEIAGEPHQDTVQKALDAASRDPAALMLSMQDMSPAQIERLLAGL